MGGTVDVILGAILSILITIWVEYLRKPKLNFQKSNISDQDYSLFPEKRPANKARFLSVVIENKPLSSVVRWLSRSAALQCHAEITYYHLDGQNVFGRAMTARWSGLVEPIPTIQISGERNQIFISNVGQNISTTRKDIYPGEGASLDIAARFDNDVDCFGWNDEAYFSNPAWRNPKWKLLPGRYIVKIELTSAGDKATNLYRLINDTDITSFRLEQVQQDDIKKILGKILVT
jgi:hypothetical protein